MTLKVCPNFAGCRLPVESHFANIFPLPDSDLGLLLRVCQSLDPHPGLSKAL